MSASPQERVTVKLGPLARAFQAVRRLGSYQWSPLGLGGGHSEGMEAHLS